MKIVFFGTSEVGLPILEALTEHHEVIHIVTSPDKPAGRKQELASSPIANFAASKNIPTSKPQSVKNNPEFLDFLRSQNADIFIVVSYGKILPAELLDIPPLKTLNVHFSLLPKYRGAAPIQYALLNGDDTTGTSIFILDEQVDHGPVLAAAKTPIDPAETFSTLAEKLAGMSAQLLIDLLPKYQAGQISPVEHDHSQATFTKLIKKEHGQIDWTMPAEQIYNMWRAYTPWPGIWTTFQGEIFKILQCRTAEGTAGPSEKQFIPCGDNSYLQLLTVQQAGKKPVPMADFLNGHPDFQPFDLGR